MMQVKLLRYTPEPDKTVAMSDATASKIFKIPLEDVDQDMRRKAKTANFGKIGRASCRERV